jgi:hypothetical protein
VTNRWIGRTIFRRQNVIKCYFCQKPQGMVRDAGAGPQTLTVSICDDCLNVPRHIEKENQAGRGIRKL